MSIKITYSAADPVSTQQMLNIAHRIMNETPGPLVVQLERLASANKVNIVLLRTANSSVISESISVEETGG